MQRATPARAAGEARELAAPRPASSFTAQAARRWPCCSSGHAVPQMFPYQLHAPRGLAGQVLGVARLTLGFSQNEFGLRRRIGKQIPVDLSEPPRGFNAARKSTGENERGRHHPGGGLAVSPCLALYRHGLTTSSSIPADPEPAHPAYDGRATASELVLAMLEASGSPSARRKGCPIERSGSATASARRSSRFRPTRATIRSASFSEPLASGSASRLRQAAESALVMPAHPGGRARRDRVRVASPTGGCLAAPLLSAPRAATRPTRETHIPIARWQYEHVALVDHDQP